MRHKSIILGNGDADIFWGKVQIREPDDCWLWTDAPNGTNCAYFRVRGETYRASRVAYFLNTGVDPGDFLVCHSCDNGMCCNPGHFFLGTDLDNTMDSVGKLRHKNPSGFGEKNTMSKLRKVQIDEIRLKVKCGFSYTQIMKEYCIARSTVSKIVLRQRWK